MLETKFGKRISVECIMLCRCRRPSKEVNNIDPENFLRALEFYYMLARGWFEYVFLFETQFWKHNFIFFVSKTKFNF